MSKFKHCCHLKIIKHNRSNPPNGSNCHSLATKCCTSPLSPLFHLQCPAARWRWPSARPPCVPCRPFSSFGQPVCARSPAWIPTATTFGTFSSIILADLYWRKVSIFFMISVHFSKFNLPIFKQPKRIRIPLMPCPHAITLCPSVNRNANAWSSSRTLKRIAKCGTTSAKWKTGNRNGGKIIGIGFYILETYSSLLKYLQNQS